ncbi:unnamed protein product [Eruca vesicaria subsp. sativa]|uniref:PWWP domain-containing protein n=1 Tax=Eruca vesicaria subsp. sativa TaxID=29727 RepID=A0ABC8JQG1_ERUVS|nr:unnamed protein product [Eruca vesicaria subsp. sativa]
MKSLEKPDKKESNAVVSMEEDDKVRKIEVSGGNISLVVDFSGPSLTGTTSSHNAFECKSNGSFQTQEECLVGNLVWTMTKSKKWWPGEVVSYKADAKESFMVRGLGEGQQLVSWCAPSKLRPFKESFERLVSSQRNDVGFFVAVGEAMTLLRNSLKLEMTCSCMAERNGRKPGNTRKTKPLILREFSVDRLEPKEFVTQLKNLAKCVSSSGGGILEVTVMQSRLSAFYSYSGHKQIPMDQLNQNEVRKSFNGSKMEESEFVGSPSIVAASIKRKFRKEWFRKFVNVSARDDLVDTSPSDLVSKLKLLAVDSTCSENVGLFEWFFSKFRMSVFHDENAYRMQLANMAGSNDLMVAKVGNQGSEKRTSKSRNVGKSKIEPFCGVSVPNTDQETFESQKNSEKSNIEVSGGVSVPNTTDQKSFESQKNLEKSKIELVGGVDQKACVSNITAEKYRTYQRASKLKKIKDTTGSSDFSSSVANEPSAKDVQEKLSLLSLNETACVADTHSKPAVTLVPDLNSGGSSLADHLQKPQTFVPPNALPQKERPFSMMLNFQAAAAAPCSNYGTGFVSSLTDLERKFTSADLCAKVTVPEKKKRGRKRKNPEEVPKVAHTTNGIPDLNGTTKEPASVQPQGETTQRRRRRKKEEMPNRATTRGITILVLKFSSKESMPSKEDLTSTFSAFGPLDASETHLYEDLSGAEVAFVSSGDAVEAVKSLDKANPFGDNLVSFRLQQKLINVYRNIAPRMPVISHVSPLQKPKNAPISVESMKQNLLMMTAMLDKSGDHLSRETKSKLKSDITALLQKISSMPSSSSSS